MVGESQNGCSGSLLLVAAQLGEPGSFRSHRADCSLFRQCVYFRGDSKCDSSSQQVHTGILKEQAYVPATFFQQRPHPK